MFENYKTFSYELAGRPLVIETGKLAQLAGGSCLVRYGETAVLANATMSAAPRDGIDFLPLSVDYEERLYAAGKIPGSWNRREGRPTEHAILASRVIDRPIRPLFPKDLRNDVVISLTVMSVDPEMKLNKYKKGKYLLRHAFEGDYLPLPILYREKAAFSDAVGHSMVDYLKAYAETKYTDDEMKLRAAKYPFATPFTKESLLYREIFEKYYPGQAEMVKDFWMPNKAWEGCDVNDPSARVLANYGASGE